MTPLNKAIRHYKKIAKTGGNQAHYALGALDVLLKIKGLRDIIREDMREYWKGRGNPTIANLYYQNKEMVHCLDNLVDTEPNNRRV